jgi:hypothetical protein
MGREEKIIRQGCFNRKGAREIFGIVWLSIAIIFLSKELTVYNRRHPRHEVIMVL